MKPALLDLNFWIDQLDQAIQSGNRRFAVRELHEHLPRLRTQPKLRPHFAKIASLCRRTGQFALGLKLLNPYVRPQSRRVVEASPEEKIAYAATLIQAGAVLEGRVLLKSCPEKEFPEVAMFRAFSSIGEWDYANALRLLERYLRSEKITDYPRLVGRLNLLACLCNIQDDERAETELHAFIAETQARKHYLLLGSAHEIHSQIHLRRNDLQSAAQSLSEAEAALRLAGGLESIYVQKWQAVLEAKRANPAAGIARLQQLRAQGVSTRAWEIVRDCDFQLGVATQDTARLIHVYSGTPFESYRKKVALELHRLGGLPPAHYDWVPGPQFRLASGVPPRELALKPGQLLHRLTLALASDFYRPMSVAGLHEALFPQRYFNPKSSPDVIRQAVKRLRAWLSQELPALTLLECGDGSYRLNTEAPITHARTPDARPPCLRILPSRPPTATDLRTQVLRQKLKAAFAKDGESFSTQEVHKKLGLPPRSAARILQELLQAGGLECVGRGRKTRYRFCG